MKESNYVECGRKKSDSLLLTEPNKETMEAIAEARSGKYAGTIDTSSMENFVKSCE